MIDFKRKFFTCSREAKEALAFLLYEDYIRFVPHVDMSTAITTTEKSNKILTFEEFMDIGIIKNFEEIKNKYESMKEKIFKEVERAGQRYLN